MGCFQGGSVAETLLLHSRRKRRVSLITGFTRPAWISIHNTALKYRLSVSDFVQDMYMMFYFKPFGRGCCSLAKSRLTLR